MSDIVERLQHAHLLSTQRVVVNTIFTEAAEEITRLRTALADERKRALEEAALRIDCNCNERCLASHEGYCPKQTVAAIRALKGKPE